MKVLLTIWISAVLIQEVIPSTLVRLPRHASKKPSLVQTEYEAKYEQKGQQGNESFSTVSGKQEIMHDNCAENWNSFADKCASLIKDLVASLANAVSSRPGDATNLQLHIKNTFKHFDNTHNCTCLNHTGNKLSDLDLSSFFNNITINTISPPENGEISNSDDKKCGGNSQSCGGNKHYDQKSNKEVTARGDSAGSKKGSVNQQSKQCGQSADGSCDEHSDVSQTKKDPQNNVVTANPTEESQQLKQPNRTLVMIGDLGLNPGNTDGSKDQLINNSRRQIEQPKASVKGPQSVYENVGASNPEQDKKASYSFFVTSQPISDSLKPSEPSGAVPDHSYSRSGQLSQNNSPNYKDSPVGPSVNNNGAPSSAPLYSVLPGDTKSDFKNKYLLSPPEIVSEPVQTSKNEDYNEENPAPDSFGSHQKPAGNSKIISPTRVGIGSPPKSSYQSPVLSSAMPVTENQKSKPAVRLPVRPRMQPEVVVLEKPVTESQKTGPNVIIPMKPNNKKLNTNSGVTTSAAPFENDQITDSAMVIQERPISTKTTLKPIVLFPKQPAQTNRNSETLLQIPKEQHNDTDSLVINHPKITSNNYDPADGNYSSKSLQLNDPKLPVIIQDGQTVQKLVTESPLSTTPEDCESDASQQPNSKPAIVVPIREGEHTADKIPSSGINLNSNFPQSSRSESDVENINPYPVYKFLPIGSSTKPSPKIPGVLSDEVEGFPSTEEQQTTTCALTTTSTSTTCAPTTTFTSTTSCAPTTTFAPTEYDQTTEAHSGHSISIMQRVPVAPEASSQKEFIPLQKPSSSQTNQDVFPTTFTPVYPAKPLPSAVEPVLHGEPSSNDPAPENDLVENQWDPHSHYSSKTATLMPSVDEQRTTTTEDSEDCESTGEKSIATEKPIVSLMTGTQLTGNSQQGPQANEPTATRDSSATTPLIIYPVKITSIVSQPSEQSAGQEIFTTPTPVYPVRTVPVVIPVSDKKKAGNAVSEPTATTEDCSEPNPKNQQENPVTHTPIKEVDGKGFSQVIFPSQQMTNKLAQPNSADHSQDASSSSSVPLANNGTPVVDSSESQPEQTKAPEVFKPGQLGILIPTNEARPHQGDAQNPVLTQPTTFQTTSVDPTPSQVPLHLPLPTHTSVPQDSEETTPISTSTSKTTEVHEHDDDDDEDCCSCESCTEEEITDPKQYKENACKNLEEARRELKAIFDKIKKKLKCGRKAPQTITAS